MLKKLQESILENIQHMEEKQKTKRSKYAIFRL